MTRLTPRHVLASLIICGSLLGLAACKPAEDTSTAPPAAAVEGPLSPKLIPAPAQMKVLVGRYVVGAGTVVHAQDDAARRVATQFADLLAKAGRPPLPSARDDAPGGIRFVIDASQSLQPQESYKLDIDNDGVVVRAGHERGLFYGAVTLWQLLTQDPAGETILPALHIEDSPRFGWRGFMLDSARHFWTVDQVKQVIDSMAIHKLNTLHWHLTDDQGWRIQILQYPKLTEIGGCRIPAGDGGKDPQTGKPVPYCGFYTQDDIRDVVKYAAARHITIVPEFDVPGHATAAIAAYPELGTIDTPLVPSNEWGVFPNLFNTEESTYTFIENVFGEIIGLFPGAYVHVGGDEAVKDQWQASPRVQKRMREVGAGDEMAMQSHLIKRLEKYLVGHGKRLIGWDEILEGGLPEEATVMSWRGIEGGIQAARQGHDVVMSPSSETYLDYLQTESPNEPPGRPATITLQQIYAFEPVPTELDAQQRKHILGLQANLWTEHTRTFARLQHHMFPRLAAVAETGWTPQAGKNIDDFLNRLPTQLQRYRSMKIDYAQTPFEVAIQSKDDRAAGTVEVHLSNPLGYPLRYTTDGSEPGPASELASDQPLTLKLPAEIHARTFFDRQPLGEPSQFRLDAASMLQRTDETLATCPDAGRLLLRLEDDGPLVGERAIFNTTIFYPCWQWNQANLDGIGGVQVRAGRIPYYFQLAHDEPNRKFEPASTPNGELVIRGGGCKGRILATTPLPAQPDADGFITLRSPLPEDAKGTQDLCIVFTGDTRPQMWVLDSITLQPR
ncbi:family 20 glycosylhydrolase [Pseudoxanthomonas dokdonensis]|uniref:beta-N-acetylhexosaminidase n=1 Tax=Pseudoxanthomonas dokdonensis TaxID=344882 RepID=A0A0R0CR69_9GAMM|nr:family 20 glycosylhydrolase [Pseudoxanthomonas dokdonensis]KRG68382.1 beta-hexosaminidase [Pseudoxanthomonas dokdonensis]